jgi:hypothetical protein
MNRRARVQRFDRCGGDLLVSSVTGPERGAARACSAEFRWPERTAAQGGSGTGPGSRLPWRRRTERAGVRRSWCGAAIAGASAYTGDRRTMTRSSGLRGWPILGICVAVGIALAVVLPGAGAGADRVKAACGQAGHGARMGWQHGHAPRRATTNQLACSLTGLAQSTTQPAAPVPRLARVPAAQTVLTLAAAGPDPAQSTPASPAPTSIGEANRRIEVAANSATAINDSLLLVGLLLGFVLAVSGLVLAAGRRGGLAARTASTLTQSPTRVDATAARSWPHRSTVRARRGQSGRGGVTRGRTGHARPDAKHRRWRHGRGRAH